MNAVEIEEAVSELFEQPFDAVTFPGAFLESFGNKPTVIKRLQSTASLSDIEGAILQRNNIHFKACPEGQVSSVFNQLKNSPATAKNKTKFILATDGVTVEAEDLSGDAPLVCDYKDFPNHFGYFLPLAGIETVKQIRDSSFDIRATSRLNRLYIELLKDNPEWGTADNRHEMNHFMARLIFCFFAEDTDIIRGERLFTTTIEQMSERDSSNTNEIISEIFRALNTKTADRVIEKLPRWTEQFPYVNGGLFAGKVDVPRFSKIARSYLLHIGNLDWTKINPDIFGSMIQAVADEEERGALGMHYTSVPNILKVLNPLFLDDLRGQLEAAGDNARTLLNLRKRITKIRVFDPACGSGNFLVIAYKQMREIENEINVRRGEIGRKTDIPLTNFRGIELRDFPAEIARLALIIAEYQCDLLYRGQKEAIDDFLPLDSQNWITHGNALKIDWLSLCPPTGTNVQVLADDLFDTPVDQAQIEFANEGGETFICGNPPYKGSKGQTAAMKSELAMAWGKYPKLAKNNDYVSAWIARYLDYVESVPDTRAAFVTTNSICQGQQASEIWPVVFDQGIEIQFAHTSFKWSNLASHNAGVTVVVIGLGAKNKSTKKIFTDETVKECASIGPYLIPNMLKVVDKLPTPISHQISMLFGNMPRDGGNLLLTEDDRRSLIDDQLTTRFIKKFIGAEDLINGKLRYCLWIEDEELEEASKSSFISERMRLCKENRALSPAQSTQDFASRPHRFVQIAGKAEKMSIISPRHFSENREYMPVGLFDENTIVSDAAFAIYDGPLWCLSLIASKLHIVWLANVCGKLKTDYRYSNTLGWNTFPIPQLTEKNKMDLNRAAEDILLARESHFPDSMADLYHPENLPQNLRDAHDRNDEVLERIYIGRRFRNDTERLEKLFELYTKMTSKK
ncbi:class I SAM-dependent DNA methyltransferase [Polynucleobacter sphagniphilus]|uniref:class I SAM-dependent DNA methyltransferase n=1 Tax=Polynucleobacter sphagniphilus TaxID=1743169 RepID=UPI00247468C3|nr:DNA methyltransferase [Polynucleobacter sphagniphilus]MDH6299415.1 hypothetical protein [Polynucleobacter sphagniphilus]